MTRIIHTLSALLIFGALSAQINRGGEPITFQLKDISSEVPFYKTPAVDLDQVAAEDAVTDQYKETPYRFGISHDVDLNFFDHASAEVIKGDRKVWRLGLDCPDAKSISFLLDEFYLPQGSELFVYSEDLVSIKGAFNFESNKESGIFPVGLIQSDRVIIEYIEPFSGEEATLHLSEITHGYRTVVNKLEEKGPWGNSGACNINTNCPEGLPWQDQKRSVAIIINGGFAQCTGAMVNNTLQDETPYFLTANHCLGNPNNWVYYFNHETAGCTGSTGPQDQSVSGGTLKASNGGSDFALVELSENVPSSYNVYFAGWDNSDALSVTAAVSIHHPSGDLKKICFEDDAPYHNSTGGAAVWWIDQWELGVTEPGSSGSPLFDQNGRVIGQLFGGAAACSGTVNNGQFDYYGRFGVSWDGSSASNRLHDWLDPNASGVTTIDGYGPNDVTYPNDVAGQSINNVPDILCALDPFTPTFTLRNQGSNTLTSATIEYSYNGSAQPSIDWTGSLEQGETDDVDLVEFVPIDGTNDIEVTVTDPNGGADDNDANNNSAASVETAPAGVGSFEITLLTDDYASETSWDVRNANGTVIESGSGYANNTEYEISVPLPSTGCYTFTLYDSFGDGICCGWGFGEYSVEDSEGNLLISGGEFASEDGGTWAMEQSTGLTEASTADFSVFPNPANDVVTINLSKELGAYDVFVINNLGQTVLSQRFNGEMTIQMDLSTLAAGSYAINVRNETVSGVERITVK